MIKKIILCTAVGLFLCNSSFAVSDCDIRHKSIKFYERLSGESPSDVCSLYNLANEYKLKKKYQKALNVYNDIIDINPKEEKAYKSRAEIYSQFNNEQYAEREYARLVKNVPYSPSGNYHMAMIYENISEYETALKYINKAIELLDDREYSKIWFYNARADILKKMGRYEEAIEDYTKYATSEIKFNYSSYWDISECYKALGNTEKEKEAIRNWDAGYHNNKISQKNLVRDIKWKYSRFIENFFTKTLY